MDSHVAPFPAICGGHVTHNRPRPDAVMTGQGPSLRQFVPTIYGQPEGNTIYHDSIESALSAGGMVNSNEDHTEIVLTLPAGHKFSCDFERAQVESAIERRTVKGAS